MVIPSQLAWRRPKSNYSIMFGEGASRGFELKPIMQRPLKFTKNFLVSYSSPSLLTKVSITLLQYYSLLKKEILRMTFFDQNLVGKGCFFLIKNLSK